MAEGARRIVGRERLVGVVEQRGGLDERVDRPAIPRASIRAASQPATSATARACRTNQGGGSRESRREAASTRPGTVIGSMVPDGQARGRVGRAADGAGRSRRRGSRSGTRPVTGIAQRKATARPVAPRAGRSRARAGAAAGRPPSARTVIPPASNPTTTVPSRSVRRTRAPDAASRSRVAFAGWPYGLPAPADATATVGRTASTNAWVVAVRLPWWATLSRSTCGRPSAEQRRVDALLDVAHQQEASRPDLAEQDDRDVVDAGPAVGRLGRDLAADRPQDAQRDLVDRQAIAGGEARVGPARPDRRASRSHAA